MLTEICQYLRNWFDRDSMKNQLPSWTEEITVSGGELKGFDGRLLNGQYFRIIDSLLNDGVYQHPATGMKDEVFTGTVQSMAIPPDVLAMDREIAAWIAANRAVLDSPYQSESFGGYSYSLKSGYGSATDNGRPLSGGGLTWQGQFAARLAPWRKI